MSYTSITIPNRFNTTSQTNSSNAFGSGNQGIQLTTRIVMSLKSRIPSEVDWALMAISTQSCHKPETIKFETEEYLANELVRYSFIPYHLIHGGKYDDLSSELFISSCNSLLSIRNLIQDLDNQQFISQIEVLKKDITMSLKFLSEFLYSTKYENVFKLNEFKNELNESFIYLIDILSILTCYYVDNHKHDQLFEILSKLSLIINDKYLIINIISCLTHLLYIKDDSEEDNKRKDKESTPVIKTSNNCINAITDEVLIKFSNYLLINDYQLNEVVLLFFKEFLFSKSLHANSKSVKDSQFLRFKELINLKDIKHNLFKKLPILILENLPLNNSPKPSIQSSLVPRSSNLNVPVEANLLPLNLYSVIAKFPEPLRATTWLRCCYKPFINHELSDNGIDPINEGKIQPGEVTQLSLWKAYEKQFSKTYHKDIVNQPLMPAVDFIKNVTSGAFPQATAMVVVLDETTQKKKFIIRGIQPRQFIVDIDTANYDALIKKPEESLKTDDEVPLGLMDVEQFEKQLDDYSQGLISTNVFINNLSDLNLLSKDLLDYIINELMKLDNSQDLVNIFRLYNKSWLPEIVYKNPNLLESEIIDNNWLKYLI